MINKSNSDRNILGVENIGSLICKMSIPIMFSMMVMALYNVVDSIFISHYSAKYLASLSIVFPLQMGIIAVCSGTAIGINSLTSRYLGAGNTDKANKVAITGMWLEIISSLVFILFGIFFSGVFANAFSSDPEITNGTKAYLSICLIISTPLMFSSVIERLMQAEGDSIHPMIVQIVGALINIVLDPVFIFGIGPFPEMGVAGAALATVLGQIAGCILGYLFYRRINILSARIHNLIKFKPEKQTIKEIYKVALPSIVLQGLTSISTLLMNIIVVAFSEIAVAVFGLYFKVQSFLYMPLFGLNSGVIPIVGYNYGARNKDRVVKTVRIAMAIGCSVMLLGTLLFQFFPNLILSPFKTTEEMNKIAYVAFRIISIGFIFSAIAIVINGFFMGIGAGVSAMSVNLARQLILLVPLAFFLSKTALGISGVWVAFPISEVLSTILAYALFIKEKNKIDNKNY
ncbi:MAG: MATE family efflux transporter, partial [Sphaerochaetaceae bacterium]|nr:MATE family efflux transporter [Sphaerochaetaceae bacterium]